MLSVSNFSKEIQSIDLIRAGFALRGTNFHAWCNANNVNSQNARKAISGKWAGPKAEKLVKDICEAAGVRIE